MGNICPPNKNSPNNGRGAAYVTNESTGGGGGGGGGVGGIGIGGGGYKSAPPNIVGGTNGLEINGVNTASYPIINMAMGGNGNIGGFNNGIGGNGAGSVGIGLMGMNGSVGHNSISSNNINSGGVGGSSMHSHASHHHHLQQQQQQQQQQQHTSNQLNGLNNNGSSSVHLGSASSNALINNSNGKQQLISQQQYQTDMSNIQIEKPNYIALFDYEQATADDMTIRKNDPLIVINKNHPDWWLAKNLRTKLTGYVPYNYITSIDDLQIKEWFFPNTSRREAERLLEYLDNEPGVFLIRESEQDNGKCWSLSILDYNDEKQRHTKHYRIRKIDTGGCYISTRNRFETLDELVAFYSRAPNGLCRALTNPCPKVTSFVGFKDVWEEDRINIELGPLIGAGNFGEVYKGLWRKRFTVAVKTLKFNDQDKRNAKKEEAKKEEFRKELEIMKKLRHEKLVKLWCVCTIGEPIYIVTEYMCNGSLLKYMREGDGANLAFKEVIDMAAQIACGMKYLEGSKCVHRDLAARNILVGERNIVKIADFGFAQMLNANDKLELSQDESNKFPVKWTAPEVFTVDPNTGLRAYTIKSDVWSFGILLYELITLGANPYPGMTHPQVINEVKDKHYRMPKPIGMCTEPYYAMMLKCWHEDPNQRPTFDSLYHFFNDFFINTQPCYRNPGEP